MNRLQKLPVPILPTFVGALTLSNVYGNNLNYPWVRYLTMAAGTIILLLYILKIIMFPKIFLEEYKTTIPSSLYAGFDMALMILGAFYNEIAPGVGKPILMIAVIIHIVHILIFTARNVIMHRDVNTTMPSWFVTYNGIMVSCVIGSAILPKPLTTAITYYGIAIYFILIIVMIWRLIKFEVKPPMYHTMAVVLAPCSLCTVSYLNVVSDPIPGLLCLLYFCVLCSLLFVIIKLPKFFSFPFTPGYAGMTFPMGIGLVASIRMAGYFNSHDMATFGKIAGQLAGIQLYLTTAIIGYILIKFVAMALKMNQE